LSEVTGIAVFKKFDNTINQLSKKKKNLGRGKQGQQFLHFVEGCCREFGHLNLSARAEYNVRLHRL
jgi:hypothetical protein